MTTTKEDCDALRLLAKNVPDLKHYAGGCDKTRGEFLRRIADKLEAESARADKLFADAMDARKKLAAIRNAMPDVQLRLMAAIKQISIAGGAVIDINQAIRMITDALKGSNASDCLAPVTDPEREAVLDQAKSVEAAEHKPRCMTRLERVRTAGLSCKNLLTQTEEYAKRLDKLDASPITPKLQAKLDEKQKVIDKLVEKLRDMTATRDDIAQELRDNVGAQKQAVTDPDKLFDDAAQDSLRAAEEAANNPAGSGDCGVYTPPDTETIADQAGTIRDCQDRCAEYSNRNDKLQGDHDQAIEDLKDMDRTINKQASQIRIHAEHIRDIQKRLEDAASELDAVKAIAGSLVDSPTRILDEKQRVIDDLTGQLRDKGARIEQLVQDYGESCEQCRVLQSRLDAANALAKSWHFASDENLTSRKHEKQKNATIRNDLAELRGFLEDLICSAERDDGVEVPVPATDDDGAPTSRPWGDQLAPPVGAGTIIGRLPRDARVLAEANYQHARHCVNSHDALMAACKTAEAWFATEVPVGYSDMRRALSDAIEKGDVKP